MELKRIDKDVIYRLNENAEDYSLIYDKPKMEIDEDKLNMAFDKAITYYIQSIKNYVYEDYYCQPLESILFERELLNKTEYQKSETAKDCLIKLNSCLDSLSKETFEEVLNVFKEDMVYDLFDEIGYGEQKSLDEWISRYVW